MVAKLETEQQKLKEELAEARDGVNRLSLSQIFDEEMKASRDCDVKDLPEAENILYQNSPPVKLAIKFDLENQLTLERAKYMDMCDMNERLLKEVKDLRGLKINVDLIRKMFGCTIKEFIPYLLNEVAVMNYCVLFDGYYRNIVGEDREFIPKDVSRLISWYYPLFWALK